MILLFSVSHFHTFLRALWLISQFRILLPPSWPFHPWSLLPAVQLELKSTIIFAKPSLDHMGLSYLGIFNNSQFSAKSLLNFLSRHWPTLLITSMPGACLHLLMSVLPGSFSPYLCLGTLPTHWAIKMSGGRAFQMEGMLELQIM